MGKIDSAPRSAKEILKGTVQDILSNPIAAMAEGKSLGTRAREAATGAAVSLFRWNRDRKRKAKDKDKA